MSRYTDIVQKDILKYLKTFERIEVKKGIFFKSPVRKLRERFKKGGFPTTTFLIGREVKKMGGKTYSTTAGGKTVSGILFNRDTETYSKLKGEENE